VVIFLWKPWIKYWNKILNFALSKQHPMKTWYFIVLLFVAVACSKPTGEAHEAAISAGTIAAQLWTFRYDLEKDVPGTLKKIKDLGFEYVEGFDAPFMIANPDEFKAQLDAAGLTMFALHWNNLEDWRKDPSMIMETAKKMGAHYTGIAWLKNTKEDTVTLQVVNEAADILMNACTQAKEAGLQLYYHIHGYELQPSGNGKTFFDSFVSRIDYSCVRLEMDVFWVTYAGQDPVQFMDNYQDGVELLHIKNMAAQVQTGVFTGANFMPPDMPADFWVPLGKGKIDYKSVFQKGRQIGVKWYILEMDKFDGDVYAAVDSSLAYIKREKLLEE
jgi:sugar phosphate isomerase/epimerase